MRMACVVGAPVYVLWRDGRHELTTEAKPGEESAANFPMYAAGRCVHAIAGVNSDAVSGRDLGILRHRIRASCLVLPGLPAHCGGGNQRP